MTAPKPCPSCGESECHTKLLGQLADVQEIEDCNSETYALLLHAQDLIVHQAAQLASLPALVEALERIESWSKAYPLEVFPEPDFKRVAEVLKANGMTLDSVSASNMRHVVTGVGEIARAALALARGETT